MCVCPISRATVYSIRVSRTKYSTPETCGLRTRHGRVNDPAGLPARRLRFDSAAPVAGCAPWERRGQTNARPGRGPEPQSSGRGGGDYPLKVTLLHSVINRWETGAVLSPGLLPPVRRTGFANRDFSLHRLFPGLRAYAQDYLGAGIVPTPQPR